METKADYSAQNTSQEGGLVPLPAKDLGRFTQLNLAHIRVNPDNPRRHFDEDELAVLANSIKIHGIRQPIEVRHIWDGSDDDEGFYQIIAGERRFRAADMIGLPMVPVLVRDVESDTEAQILALVENMQRANLNPIEEATAYENLMKFGVPQERIAAQVGVQQSLISRRVGLLRLPESVKVSIASGKLSATHGVILNGISESHATVAESFAQEAIDNQWNVATLTEKVNGYRAEMERQAKANAEAAQPRLLDTDSRPIDSVKSITLEEQAKLQEKPDATKQDVVGIEAKGPEPGPATSTPTTDTGEYTGDMYLAEPSTNDSANAESEPATGDEAVEDGLFAGGREAAARFAATFDDTPIPPVTADPAKPSTNKPTQALPASRDEIITPLAYLLLSALLEQWNQEHPDKPMTMQERLESILFTRAEQAGIDTEAIETEAGNV